MAEYDAVFANMRKNVKKYARNRLRRSCCVDEAIFTLKKEVSLMLNQKLVSLINKQINMEWYSAYLYLEIHGFYVDKDLSGFGNWFYVQAQEERDHAMLFIKYLQNNNEKSGAF
jgi:hypothetical protein